MSNIEQSEGGETPEADQLQYRLDQQSYLAEFGMAALRADDTSEILDKAAEIASKGMRSRFSKLLCFREAEQDLLLVAGVGWEDGVVGFTTLQDDTESPAGYAFHHGESVISNHLENEKGFRTPEFMRRHGIERAINILIKVKDRKWGVLEVDSKHDGKFSEHDLAFMQALADLIGVALGRQETETRLTEEAEYQTMLNREASHRVKNSLALVTAMLTLQSRGADEATVQSLAKARHRVKTIADAHDLLWQSSKLGTVDMNKLLCGIVEGLEQSGRVKCEVGDLPDAQVSADTAIPAGLIVNELVTNALKYAYPVGEGIVHLEAFHEGSIYRVVVTDNGQGLPTGAREGGGLGMRLVNGLGRQLRADVRFEDNAPGTRVILEIPIGDDRGSGIAQPASDFEESRRSA